MYIPQRLYVKKQMPEQMGGHFGRNRRYKYMFFLIEDHVGKKHNGNLMKRAELCTMEKVLPWLSPERTAK